MLQIEDIAPSGLIEYIISTCLQLSLPRRPTLTIHLPINSFVLKQMGKLYIGAILRFEGRDDCKLVPGEDATKLRGDVTGLLNIIYHGHYPALALMQA